MALPSFDRAWPERKGMKPRILVLEIRDKDRVEESPLCWIVVEREEKYERDSNDEICSASIRLSYRRITGKHPSYESGHGQFDGSYSRFFNAVSLTSSSMAAGSVYLGLPELHGQRIGTYLMNVVVEWVQQWPDAAVNPIELRMGQARADNKARRNRFYEQFGLRFDYLDSGKREGLSRPIQVRALNVVETWKKNIFEHTMFDHLAERLDAVESAQAKLAALNHAYVCLREKQKNAEARPFRWAIKRLYNQSRGLVTAAAILAVCISLFWFKTR